MLRFRPLFTLALSLAVTAIAPRHASGDEPPFEIKEGDRLALLGDALLERENTYGLLETRLHEQFPDRSFIVRNLAWSGDTPAGWSRASFDGPEKGIDRLKEHLALVKPTVVFLGYGMAASLQELTDRAQDPTLNPDPARYGAEPMNVARFKKELGALMDLIEADRKADAENRKEPVRFVLLSPIKHEDLRPIRPGTPDPTEHNRLLAEYSKGIEEIGKERGVRTVSVLDLSQPHGANFLTDDGVHLSSNGYRSFTNDLILALFKASQPNIPQNEPGLSKARAHYEPLRAAILRKNDLFFHRFRPANSTYLFGFRKHEQGQNAKEMAEFEPLLATADKEIDEIKRHPEANPNTKTAEAKLSANPPSKSDPAKDEAASLPLPQFDLDPSLEMTLWAETPMLGKPTQMCWDADGRLWVSCTPIYPQILPGAHPDDKVVILEDTDRDGKADKSTVFADDLLIPSGVAVDLAFKTESATPKASGSQVLNAKSPLLNACYVGASTEIVRLEDTNGDGKADSRRVVLSGFGTEDTHHTVHTLRWGPDGRLYFDQSVYIHTHLETPWGMVRLNSGGVFSYDPRTERVEVFSKGLWNPWGHAWDQSGQAFLTDGAGFNGISWAFPGAVFNPSEGARKTMPSISPGNYPKFAGLELIRSPLFPADWQGTAVTCDFRAHRVVRFAIDDLGVAKTTENAAPLKSGYITRELPDVARTADLSFRPIDVKLGPDGALYLADWTNPVINHGEVDFRDPRRDHVHGRIWRIAPKGSTALKWEKVRLTGAEATREDSSNAWKHEQVQRMQFALGHLQSNASSLEPAAAELGKSEQPRARVAAMRSLALQQKGAAAGQVLDLALNAPPEDPYYEFAAWASINDLASVWTEALAKGEWKADSAEKHKQLAWGLGAIRPELASAALSRLMAAGQIPLDGSGPWLELLGQAGDANALGRVFDTLVQGKLTGDPAARALRALAEAGRNRGIRPTSELKDIASFIHRPEPEIAAAAMRAAGPWRIRGFLPLYAQQARSEQAGVRDAAVEALRETGGASPEARTEAVAALAELCSDDQQPALRRRAAAALASLDLRGTLSTVADVLTNQTVEAEAIDTWRGVLAAKDSADILATSLPRTLPPVVAKSGLRAAREIGKKGEKLVAFLTPLTGEAPAPPAPRDWTAMGEAVKRDGDPARGEEIYRRTALACTTCHAIGGAGGKVGPELGTLGASAPLDYIIESVMVPNAKVKEGYNAVNLTLKDGTAAAGVLARETDKDLVLRLATGQEQSVPKANVTARENLGSLMPAGLTDQLKDRERVDLCAFLAQLGKAGVYDTSKANVARTWWLYSKANAEAAGVGALKGGDGFPALTNVDGRVTKERLTELAAMVQGDAIFAVAKFNAAAAGKTPLNLQGVREAWLDGQPLPVASEPSPSVNLKAGDHVLAVKLDPAQLPATLRAAADAVRFLNE